MDAAVIILIIIVVIFVSIMVIVVTSAPYKPKEMSPEELKTYFEEDEKKSRQQDAQQQIKTNQSGSLNQAMICPHCQARGTVRTKSVKQKKGISGAKATGALLTGGISLIATGLSRKESATQAHCDKCNSTWFF